MKTIKKAILILASVISLSVICGCKQEPHIEDISNNGTVEALSKKDYSIYPLSERINAYYIYYRKTDDYRERVVIYYNTTNDLKSATKLENFSEYPDICLYTEEQCYDTYYFWGYRCISYLNDPRESGVTPEVVTYKFENKVPYPKNLKVEYSSEVLNEIVVTWDPIYDDKWSTLYYLYSNTVNDISSAKKVKDKERDFFYYDSETSGGLIYKQIPLEDKSLYFWVKVKASKDFDECYSYFSEPVSLNFKHKKPDVPTGFSVTGTGKGTATLKLNEKATRKPKFYKIYCAEENDFSKVIYKKTLYSTAETAIDDGKYSQTDYFSYTNKIGTCYWYDLFYEGESFYFWIKAADTPDEDANPETESELVGPVSVTF